MNHFKMALAGAALLAVLAVPAAAEGHYPDLNQAHWAFDDMDRASNLGILSACRAGKWTPAAPCPGAST